MWNRFYKTNLSFRIENHSFPLFYKPIHIIHKQREGKG